MKIKEGYNGEELEIRINARDNGTIELWITQNGIPEGPGIGKYKETLSYMTPAELLELQKEVQTAAKDLFNI